MFISGVPGQSLVTIPEELNVLGCTLAQLFENLSLYVEDEEGGQDEGGEACHSQKVFFGSKTSISKNVTATDNVGDEEKPTIMKPS